MKIKHSCLSNKKIATGVFKHRSKVKVGHYKKLTVELLEEFLAMCFENEKYKYIQ